MGAVLPPLDRSTTLSSGQRLRTRLPQRADLPRLRELLERLGLAADDLQLSRWVRFDPRQDVAAVATVLLDRTEELVGFAVAGLDAPDCDVLVADEEQAPGAAAALEAAVAAHRARRIA